MPFDLDAALGVHAQALSLRSRRAEVLAANLANVDTPGYKARDLDFAAELERAALPAVTLTRTAAGHLGADPDTGGVLKYRVPVQPSLDGNTVDGQLEHAEFAKNAIAYQASLQFLDSRIAGIRRALSGE